MYRREAVNVRFRAEHEHVTSCDDWAEEAASSASFHLHPQCQIQLQRFPVQFEWINYHLTHFLQFPAIHQELRVIGVIKVRILHRSLICTSSQPLIMDETKLQTSLPHRTSSVTHPDLIFAAPLWSDRFCENENGAPFEWIHAFSFQLVQQRCDRWRGKVISFSSSEERKRGARPGASDSNLM